MRNLTYTLPQRVVEVELDLELELDFKSKNICGFDRIFQSILQAGIETQNLDWIFGFYATMFNLHTTIGLPGIPIDLMNLKSLVNGNLDNL